MGKGEDSVEFFERREQEEREAAAKATSEVARNIHLKLAAEYASKAEEKRGKPSLGSVA